MDPVGNFKGQWVILNMENNNVPLSLNLTSGLLVINIRNLIGMMGISECNFDLALAKQFNQYAGHFYYMKTKKDDPVFNRPSAWVSVTYDQIKSFLLVYEAVKTTIYDQVGWWEYMGRVIWV